MFGEFLTNLADIVAEFFKKEESWLVFLLIGLGGAAIIPILTIDELLRAILMILKYIWWLLLFLILFPTFKSLWLHWRQEIFKDSIKWKLLEIRIPRETLKSPQAMEQVLKAIHALRNAAGDVREKYWDGEVTRWFSLEMVSFSGEIHLYIRLYHKYRNLVEAAFFSYYQDIELVEVDDYINKFPATTLEMYKKGMDLWGSEMILAREDAYPIKTYADFENIAEEKQFDPISSFLEVLAKVQPGETVGIQINIIPASADWGKKWEKFLSKLQEPMTATISSENEEEGSRKVTISRSPGQIDILEAVEESLSMPAFNTLIRFIYFSPHELFYDSFARRGLTGAFNQYSALNLNSFRQNYPMSTRTRIWNWPHVAPAPRNEYRKQRLLYNFQKREIPPEEWVGRIMTSYWLNWNFASRHFAMNVRGLATLFHPPTAVVLTGPHVPRVESRKTGPPAGLAIFGTEEEIERYK